MVVSPREAAAVAPWAVAREPAFSVGGLDSTALDSGTLEWNAFCHWMKEP